MGVQEIDKSYETLYQAFGERIVQLKKLPDATSDKIGIGLLMLQT